MEFILSGNTRVIAEDLLAPIRNGAEILRRDLAERLTGKGPENCIRVEVDPEMAPETYRVKVTPEEIQLRCGDDLGAVYAMLSVSERLLGVHPLDWWMEIPTKQAETIAVAPQKWESPSYRVRFRSWFINDEVLFTGWHREESQRYEVWKRAFEAILRCGGNMVIP